MLARRPAKMSNQQPSEQSGRWAPCPEIVAICVCSTYLLYQVKYDFFIYYAHFRHWVLYSDGDKVITHRKKPVLGPGGKSSILVVSFFPRSRLGRIAVPSPSRSRYIVLDDGPRMEHWWL